MLGSAKIPAFNKTLPVGNVKKNFSAIIEVRVRNSVGETNSVDIPVIVSMNSTNYGASTEYLREQNTC